MTNNPLVPDILRESLPSDLKTHVELLRAILGPEVQPLKEWALEHTKCVHASARESTQQHWAEKLTLQRIKEWKDSGSQRDLCRKALQGPTTAAWLSSLPSASPHTQFEHCDYKIAMQWWLGMPLVDPADVGNTCAQCGACQDAFGDHAVCCQKKWPHRTPHLSQGLVGTSSPRVGPHLHP